MARSYNLVEVNKFNAGLKTDASPLTTIDNSSLEEDNFILNIDGSRNRRLGMDYEPNHEVITSPVEYTDSLPIGISTFRWDNAGGDPDRTIEVVQIGNTLDFFDLNSLSVSSGYFHREVFSTTVDVKFSFTIVDGLLVVVNGSKDVYILSFIAPSTITKVTKRLLVRDFFGVEDVIGGVDITRGSEVQDRPTTTTNAHTYNLRNQSWGIPRVNGNSEVITDTISAFRERSGNKFPSNSDSVVSSLYPDAGDSDDRVSDRFFARDLYKNPLGTQRAAMGYYIIDVLDRGASRLAENTKNMARYPELTFTVAALPQDETPAGATTITEFAGRVFYGGFSGVVLNGDGHSPKLSSYILFSKVVESIADINVCYQAGDPTSKDFPDIVATDGGFIRLNGAYGIQKILNLGSSLIVVAMNGVWRIVGGDNNGFIATAYTVEKISDRGCTSPDSITVVDNGLMFWSDDAIYSVSTDQFGSWVNNNISFGNIQKFYDDIDVTSKQSAYGDYDSYERKVRWIYHNSISNMSETKELVLDLQLQAFYTNTIKKLASSPHPKPVSLYLGLAYSVDTNQSSVVVSGDQVVVNSDPVVITVEQRLGINQRELGYLVVTAISPTIKYTFAKYANEEFRDWVKADGIGVDAEAYMVTSYMSGTDFQRGKQLPYITVHLRRTEIGYDNEMHPLNPSSCLVQARWDWSDSDKSGKWGREFQAYRYRQLHLPIDNQDDYDTGFSTIVSRNKLRGNGKVLSLRFRTEPGKNLHLYGWSMIFSVAENV